jgi:hypothetical protein
VRVREAGKRASGRQAGSVAARGWLYLAQLPLVPAPLAGSKISLMAHAVSAPALSTGSLRRDAARDASWLLHGSGFETAVLIGGAWWSVPDARSLSAWAASDGMWKTDSA